MQVLASRLTAKLSEQLENLPLAAQPAAAEQARMARDAAHWVIVKSAQDLRQAMFTEISRQAQSVAAQQLPHIMVFPLGIPLERSEKNIYGVLPPSAAQAEQIDQLMVVDDRAWLADKSYFFDGQTFSQGRFDGAWYGNALENSLSRALDEAPFVVWWHRNPSKKPFSVRVVRADHEHYFYPDFVVCVRHNPADEAIARLMETKDDLKDTARKLQHWPAAYGKVLFLTPDGDYLCWVSDDGAMAEQLDLSDLSTMLNRLAATRPL